MLDLVNLTEIWRPTRPMKKICEWNQRKPPKFSLIYCYLATFCSIKLGLIINNYNYNYY